MRARILLVVALLVGCSGGGRSTSSPASSGAQASTASELQLGPGQRASTIGESFQYGAFVWTFGEAVYDEPKKAVYIGARYENIGDTWTQPDPTARLRSGSGERNLAGSVSTLPPGATAETTLTVTGVEGDPFADGVIAWGRPELDQPEIHLNGDAGKRWLPVPVAIDAWGQIGKYSVHITGGRIIAASLKTLRQSAKGERVLRVDHDVFASAADPVNGWFPGEHLRLQRPDGSVVEAVGASDGFAVEAWTAASGNWLEFPVAADPKGRYELLLSSVSPASLGSLHDELIERLPIPFELGEVTSGEVQVEPLPRPTLPSAEAPAAEGLERELDVGVMNVPGFLFEPTKLTWDPKEANVFLQGQATFLTTTSDDGTGLLDVTPAFNLTAALVSGGVYYAGVGHGDLTVPPGPSKTITFKFLGVRTFDADDAGVVIGRNGSQLATLPLGRGSNLPSSPPSVVEGGVIAPPAVAADWTVQPVAYRVGLLQMIGAAPPGFRDLEIFFDVTASPTAREKAFGLGFYPRLQLFLSGRDGYLFQASGESGGLQFKLGQTQRMSATFHVPDSFTPGHVGLVLRGNDDGDPSLANEWVETVFGVDLGAASAAPTEGF